MSARESVRRARLALGVAAIVAAVLWSTAVFLSTVALAGLADWGVTLAAPIRAGVVPLGTAAAALAFALVLWRARRVRSPGAVALWLEEVVPSLRYTLVTAAESGAAEHAPELERAAAAADLTAPAARVIARALGAPVGALAAAAVLLLLLPAGVVARVRAPAPGEPREGAAPPPVIADRLTPLVAMVTPPAYSGLPARTLEDPSGVAALVASRIVLGGRGAPRGMTARLGDATLAVEGDGARWRVILAMPARPVALRLADGARERLVILEPMPDSAPVVTLLTPVRDTVVPTPSGTLGITADARDDFGLADAWLEYIVSSGEGESFTFRSGVLARTDARGERAASLGATLRLEALELKPGDMVHLRAVARDRNDATGPDSGVSETRTIRVLRRGEYDSVAVEGAPPPDADKSVISERMLILLTEDLQRRRPRLAPAAVTTESVRIGREQAWLRKQLSGFLFARLGASAQSEESQALDDSAPPKNETPDEMLRAADAATNAGAGALDFAGDETPVVAVNRTLLEAYNAMWDAERQLQVGEPGEALPYMRSALAAIQRARAAERLYLRGRPPAAVLDLAKVRLAGKRDDASGTARAPRPAIDSTAARRTRRLDAALALLATNAGAALDSLLLLRVDAIEQDPPLAAALGAAIDALRAGRAAAALLARARRAATGAPAAEHDGTRWEGAW